MASSTPSVVVASSFFSSSLSTTRVFACVSTGDDFGDFLFFFLGAISFGRSPNSESSAGSFHTSGSDIITPASDATPTSEGMPVLLGAPVSDLVKPSVSLLCASSPSCSHSIGPWGVRCDFFAGEKDAVVKRLGMFGASLAVSNEDAAGTFCDFLALELYAPKSAHCCGTLSGDIRRSGELPEDDILPPPALSPTLPAANPPGSFHTFLILLPVDSVNEEFCDELGEFLN
mmetsp:Transcript_25984/g.38051  ORF Transcript_25984/g.38051 Transcript_25984/m.38051 type:complete len:230 (-) Transcript_25984:120-809(-)